MSHIWSQDPDGLWTAREIADAFCGTCVEFGKEITLFQNDGNPRTSSLIMRADASDGDERWVLMSRERSLRVNGRSLDAGITVLSDRDEIHACGARVYFSTERIAEVQPFPHEESVVCPRCRMPITHASPALRCPRCKVWHHQSNERRCYTYAEHCATCARATDLDRGFEWTPMELGAHAQPA